MGRIASIARMRADAADGDRHFDDLVEGVAGVGVGGVAEARDAVGAGGDLLRARGSNAGGVAAAEVVGVGGVIPEGLDGSVAVVGALFQHWLDTKRTIEK